MPLAGSAASVHLHLKAQNRDSSQRPVLVRVLVLVPVLVLARLVASLFPPPFLQPAPAVQNQPPLRGAVFAHRAPFVAFLCARRLTVCKQLHHCFTTARNIRPTSWRKDVHNRARLALSETLLVTSNPCLNHPRLCD